MNFKSWLSSLLILISLTTYAQQRSDSLQVLNVRQLPQIKYAPSGLRSFKLDIKPMAFVEPEIYLFGPSDLVPSYFVDFRVPDAASFSLFGGYPNQWMGQEFNLTTNNSSLWIHVGEKSEIKSFEIGKISGVDLLLELGNQQYTKTKNNEYLGELDLYVRVKTFGDIDTTTLKKDSYLFNTFDPSAQLLFLPTLHFSLQTNPLFYTDNWQIDGNIQSINHNKKEWDQTTLVRLKGVYKKNLTFAESYIQASGFFSKSSVSWNRRQSSFLFINAGLKLDVESSFYQLGLGWFTQDHTTQNQTLNVRFSAEYHGNYFHQSVDFQRYDIESNLEDVFQSPLWFSGKDEPNNSLLRLSPDFPIRKIKNKTRSSSQWIPSPNWMFELNVHYQEFYQLITTPILVAQTIYQKSVVTQVVGKYYFSPISTLMLGGRTYQFIDSDPNLVKAPFQPLITYFSGLTYVTENLENHIQFNVYYHLDEYAYQSPAAQNVGSSTEINARYENFHWRQINFFADLRLYLRKDDSALSRYVHQNNVVVGLNFNF